MNQSSQFIEIQERQQNVHTVSETQDNGRAGNVKTLGEKEMTEEKIWERKDWREICINKNLKMTQMEIGTSMVEWTQFQKVQYMMYITIWTVLWRNVTKSINSLRDWACLKSTKLITTLRSLSGTFSEKLKLNRLWELLKKIKSKLTLKDTCKNFVLLF